MWSTMKITLDSSEQSDIQQTLCMITFGIQNNSSVSECFRVKELLTFASWKCQILRSKPIKAIKDYKIASIKYLN